MFNFFKTNYGFGSYLGYFDFSSKETNCTSAFPKLKKWFLGISFKCVYTCQVAKFMGYW